ncbi:MAG: hypothetical protein ABIO02_01620, partial [Patescibacteria group bacterium]
TAFDLYNGACHDGPHFYEGSSIKNQPTRMTNFAIILDKNRILNGYQNEVAAIGGSFHNERRKGKYNFDPTSNTVFGIPIKNWQNYFGSIEPYPDEVIIHFKRNDAGITPNYWSGLVVDNSLIEEMKLWQEAAKLNHLPLFTPQGQVIL